MEVGYNRGEVAPLQQAQRRFLYAAEKPSMQRAHALYYAGLVGYRLLPLHGDADAQHEALDTAIAALREAVEEAPQMADAHALLSALYGWKIGKQWYKAPVLGPKAGRAMQRAEDLAPQNPRVVLLAAISRYQRPALFGGDKQAALAGFERAAHLAALSERAASPLAPAWGHAEALAWAGIAHAKAGRYRKAETALRAALESNPDFGWVRDVLLPQLARAQQ